MANIENCSSSCDVIGDDRAGGLVGCIAASAQYCYATGDVRCDDVGGAVGGFAGWIEDGATDQCYATGEVSGDGSYLGGFVGYVAGIGG